MKRIIIFMIILIMISIPLFADFLNFEQIINRCLRDTSLTTTFYNADQAFNLIFDPDKNALRVYLDSLGTLEVGDTLFFNENADSNFAIYKHSGDTLAFSYKVAGAWSDIITFNSSGDITIAGDLIISSDINGISINKNGVFQYSGNTSFTMKPKYSINSYFAADNNFTSYAFKFTSAENKEFTGSNLEQNMMEILPRVNQSGTAAFNALHIEMEGTINLGDGTTGHGNNYILCEDESGNIEFKVGLDGIMTVGTVEYHSVTVTLSAAQVNALRASPQTIIAAQGANTWIKLVSAIVTYDYGSATFTVGADEDLVIEWADGTDATAGIETTGFIDQAKDEIRYYPFALSAGADPEASLNQALRIFNTGTGETADGTGCEVDITVVYRVIATGF